MRFPLLRVDGFGYRWRGPLVASACKMLLTLRKLRRVTFGMALLVPIRYEIIRPTFRRGSQRNTAIAS
jgi:hypothetical protein